MSFLKKKKTYVIKISFFIANILLRTKNIYLFEDLSINFILLIFSYSLLLVENSDMYIYLYNLQKIKF